MKILQISNKVPIPPRDGGSIATLRLSKALVELGHEVTVLAMNTKKHFIDPEFYKPLAKALEINLIGITVSARISVLPALINLLLSSKPYTAVRFSSTQFQDKLKELLKADQFDWVVVENLYPMVYLKTIRKHCRCKIIMRAHNIEHEIWERTASQQSGLRAWYLRILAKRIKKMEQGLINRYDYLWPITTRDATKFAQMGNNKPVHVLATGIEMTTQPPVLTQPGQLTVAHLGALDWSPNQEGILWFLKEVWPRIRMKFPDAVFQLAGRNAPDSFVQKLNLPGVIYHGEVDSALDFIQHFPIHIVPLWSGSGMRIKIIEAMASGRVIVTTPIGIEGIEALDEVHVSIKSQAQEFAESIMNLWQNENQLSEMSQNAYTFVATHFNNTTLVRNGISFILQHDINS